MKRYGVTITFDVEVTDNVTEEDVEGTYYRLMEDWEDIYRTDVEVGKPEYEAL